MIVRRQMSLTRVLLLFPLLLLCTSSSPAQIRVTSHLTATELRDLCREYIATDDATHPAGQCLGYIEGAVDAINVSRASILSIHPHSTVPLPPAWCAPKEGTTDELVRVFLKFIDGHPEKLSHAAADVVWQALSASYPCLAT